MKEIEMFIDAHAHAYRNPTPFVTLFPTAEQLIERYDREGIEKGILLPIVNPEIYLPQANEEILDMCEKYPGRLFPFCNIDPRALTNSCDAPLDRMLRYYKDKGCRGVGEIMPNLPFMHPMVQNLFKHAQDAKLPVSFCGSDQLEGDFGLYDDPGLPGLEHTLPEVSRTCRAWSRPYIVGGGCPPGHSGATQNRVQAERRTGRISNSGRTGKSGRGSSETVAKISQSLR